ncbi:hypothetical protein [Alloactinosynnema sp. L-07]|uniref:hypothetical protein n=1 Tax=Alloactinosynnema sp. L-07 TaxID=1653480 RepID=UPI00065F0A34|nr:hypothetical protein [Alloactinosynnema sp. L-07]CRK58749.1 hypothetical protein [Alloactinosynnema sp. L-07]
MHEDPLAHHPDLTDPDWLAKATKSAEKDIRRIRRRARMKSVWLPRLFSAALVLAILATGYFAYQRGLFGNSEPTAATPAAGPSTTVTTMIPDVTVDPRQPFVGTPAATWADGEAGIVAPAAQPVGRHSAAQVSAAYDQVRQVLIASRLDRAVIEGRDRERVLALLAPGARDEIREIFADPIASAWTTMTADGFPLLPAPPKVNGTMSASVDSDGHLVVHTDYVIAYAFQPDPNRKIRQVMDIVAAYRAQASYRLVSGSKWMKSHHGLWLDRVDTFVYSLACDPMDKGLLAPAYSERDPNAESVTRDGDYYFDPANPIGTENTCD